VNEMSEAESYYQSLLQQGYNVDQAKVYTLEHYPGFVSPAAPAIAAVAPAAVAPQSNSADPNLVMMMMNQQNQQMMMQQQAMLSNSQNYNQPQQIIVQHAIAPSNNKSIATGYLLWCCCFLFLCGIHRFYYNKPISGIIYVLTFGLFGFGQLYDLLVMPELAKTA
jgi:hypothetical protein|tara:strand:+ start:726 stop:1220 length:495 start_codon:yes stop_codon:yes gene_type:complete